LSDVFHLDRGPSSGPAILLVHGLGVSGRYFEPLTRMLSTAYRVLTPDLLGFGDSARTGTAPSIEAHAASLERVVDRAQLDHVVLLGHSMGSQVVTEMAARRPERTRGVVLVGPVVDPTAATALRQGWRLARDSALEPPWLQALTTREYLRAGMRSYRQSLTHMLGYRIEDRLAEVSAPVEVVRGGHDPIASRAFVAALTAVAPLGRAHEIPAARHLAMATHPGAVAALLRGLWLPDAPTRAAGDLGSDPA
jgi:pimeloyl-ACP methyl ester carboxylesterase